MRAVPDGLFTWLMPVPSPLNGLLGKPENIPDYKGAHYGYIN
jgi:hypothetical protein